jgi:hypothetical protein
MNDESLSLYNIILLHLEVTLRQSNQSGKITVHFLHMLENIALIASLISALAAVTTSFRAMGVSREYSRSGLAAALKTSCRIGSRSANQPVPQRSSLRLHLLVTVIWYMLSIIFSVPFFIQKMESDRGMWLFIWISVFLLLIILISLIWKKVLPKNQQGNL